MRHNLYPNSKYVKCGLSKCKIQISHSGAPVSDKNAVVPFIAPNCSLKEPTGGGYEGYCRHKVVKLSASHIFWSLPEGHMGIKVLELYCLLR